MEEKVEKIIYELSCRKGFDNWWDDIDDDIKEEIKQEIISILVD
jgi:hypothetical protein